MGKYPKILFKYHQDPKRAGMRPSLLAAKQPRPPSYKGRGAGLWHIIVPGVWPNGHGALFHKHLTAIVDIDAASGLLHPLALEGVPGHGELLA